MTEAEKGDMGIIHAHCAEDRIKRFQAANPVIKLEVGDFAKLGFPVDLLAPDKDKEWMYVAVHSCDNKKQTAEGQLANDPFLAPFNGGDVFSFEYKEICGILKPKKIPY